MRNAVRRLLRRKGDDGAALPFIAIILVLLIGMAAFAVDLGWIYLNGSRVQRAADAAALAGVVYLPGDTDNVNNFTINGAQANGYSIGTLNGGPTGSGGPDSLAWRSVADNKLEVTLDSAIDSFFVKVFGFDTFNISRVATAEYIKPVPLGSPDPCFGVGPGVGGGDCSPSAPQNFWAAVSGPYTNKYNGDAHSTRWWSDSGWSPPDNANPEYRNPATDTYVGYYMGVEVPANAGTVTVDIYDAGFYDRGDFQVETGDREQNSNGGADTHFRLWDFDATPLDPSDNNTLVSGCSFDISAEASAGTYRNRWANLCTMVDPPPGLYILQVWTTGNIGGTNQYAVRANTSGVNNARVFGINDMSIFTNQGGATSTLFLAEVDEVHAGKILELEFYDPGEDDANAYMTVQTPNGSTAQCDWFATAEAGLPDPGLSGSGNCRIQTSNGSPIFNGYWVHAEIDIPDNYTCGSDCWFKMIIENSQPHDRTTWTARVIGNPVRLTPNQ